MLLVGSRAGCALLSPSQEAAPTPLEAAGVVVEVAVDSQTDRPLAITISQGVQLRGALILGACEASNLIVTLDGPFTVGLGDAADYQDAPMTPLIDSTDINADDGENRMLIEVSPDGSTRVGGLFGVFPIRAAGCQERPGRSD